MGGGRAGLGAGKRYIMGCAQPGSQLFLGEWQGDRRVNDLAGHETLPIIKEMKNVCPCRCQGWYDSCQLPVSWKGREDRAATDDEVNSGACLCLLKLGKYRLSGKKVFLTERLVKH